MMLGWSAHAQNGTGSIGSRGGGTTSSHIEAFILKNAATGVAFNGAVSDSVAGGSSFVTSWVPIAGAQQVVFGIRDSLPASYGTCSPCTPVDSVSVAQVQVSMDTLTWATFAWPATFSTAATPKDTAMISLSGVLALVPLTTATSKQVFGYKLAKILNYEDGAKAGIITMRYARLQFTVATRPRDIAGTGAGGNAPLLGIRMRCWIYRNMDASLPRQFE
jgi:hypothetical protein